MTRMFLVKRSATALAGASLLTATVAVPIALAQAYPGGTSGGTTTTTAPSTTTTAPSTTTSTAPATTTTSPAPASSPSSGSAGTTSSSTPSMPKAGGGGGSTSPVDRLPLVPAGAAMAVIAGGSVLAAARRRSR